MHFWLIYSFFLQRIRERVNTFELLSDNFVQYEIYGKIAALRNAETMAAGWLAIEHRY